MVAVAFLLDLLVGDPAPLVFMHPVVLIGKLVKLMERVLYRQASRLRGAVLVIAVCAVAYASTHYLIVLFGQYRILLELWLLSTALAARGLYDSGMKVQVALQGKNLETARQHLAEIVGRDTAALDEREIVRATVETVAENLVDGVTAPLFYALLGGAPLAIMYKAINTMDSMLGHKDDRYFSFGWAAARLDDVANYLPARLTGMALVAASRALSLNYRRCRQTILRDAGKHSSPNAGIPEAGVAGALGVSLGGINYYDGEPHCAALLGDPRRELEVTDILLTTRLMFTASAIFLIGGMLLQFAFRRYFGV
ncbi:MAG: cobalamin biosynthesis protein CobD [Peptococcaceae bacterium]|nr:cobalamin biosynthesis protein CobD [Peptococcaceae bacterium]